MVVISPNQNYAAARPVEAALARRRLEDTMGHRNAMNVSILPPFSLVASWIAAGERFYDPRPYDSRYARDFDPDDRRSGSGRGGRHEEPRRDYDRGYRDYDRGGYSGREGNGREREGRDYDRRYDDRRY